MNKILKNKYNWMILAIAVLVLLNISTLVTIILIRNQNIETEQLTISNPEVSEESSLGYSTQYFNNRLQFSKVQMNKFSGINPTFRNRVIDINSEMERLRTEMLIEMSATNSNRNRLDQLSDSIGSLHAQLKKETYKFYLDIKRICNKNQEDDLEQMFSMIFTPGSQGGNGMGGRQLRLRRRQGGRQFN